MNFWGSQSLPFTTISPHLFRMGLPDETFKGTNTFSFLVSDDVFFLSMGESLSLYWASTDLKNYWELLCVLPKLECTNNSSSTISSLMISLTIILESMEAKSEKIFSFFFLFLTLNILMGIKNTNAEVQARTIMMILFLLNPFVYLKAWSDNSSMMWDISR